MIDDQFKIKTKKDLKYYLACDKAAIGVKKARPSFIPLKDKVWKFEIFLRKTEYYSNQKGILNKVAFLYHRYLLAKKMERHCLEIPLNCIREGLVIWHLQNIIINGKCKIGRNFSISGGVKIGQRNDIIPEIGDNNTLMLDCMVLGAKTSNNVAIGAGAILTKDALEPNTVFVGIPAKKLSNNIPNAIFKRKQRIDSIKR